MKVTNKIKIYLDDKHLVPPIDVMQGDANTRVLEFALYEGGSEWPVPAGASVAVAYRRADGRKGIYDTLADGSVAYTVAGNVVTVTLVPQALAVPGNTAATVVFTDTNGDQLATFCVILRVERNPAVGAVEPEDYYNLRQMIAAEVESLLDGVSVTGGGNAYYFNVNYSGDNYVSDKNFSELVAAYNKGRALYCVLSNNLVLSLVNKNSGNIVFQSVNDLRYFQVTITSEDTVIAETGDYALSSDVPAAPVRGIDYWTEEDQAAIDADIASELAKRGQLKPEFANSIEDCTDTSKLYVLPDGYIYAYILKHIVKKTNEYNPSTAKLNYRLNSSAAETAQDGILLTDYISVALSSPYMVNISGVSLSTKSYGFYVHVTYFNSSKSRIGAVQLTDSSAFESFADGNYSFDLYNESYAAASYVRLSLGISDVAITADDIANLMIEFATKSVDEYSEGWANTGHAFVPADYEDRIIALEEKVSKQDGTSDNTVVLPNYWQGAVDVAIAKVKALQDVGGKDVVNFLWFSDMHYAPGNQYVVNLGSLCAAVMDTCNIPLAVNSGDTMSAAIASTEDQLLQWLSGSNDVLAPIGTDRLLTARGNHDDVYGSTDTVSYVNKASSKRVWNVLHRAQATDFRRVYGPEGTYFYIDNPAQRTRFIVLDGYRYSGDGYSNGASSAMTSGYGQTQMAWFANEALPADKPGWSVVIVQHVPPTSVQINDRAYQIYGGDVFRGILTAYCNKSAYSGSYSGTEDNTIGGIDVDYTDVKTADVIGVFCGHCHVDSAVTDDLPCPILIVTCATNSPYDGTAADRVVGTDKETALDIVSINKATRTIHTTRLGAGNDRTITY